MPKSWILTNYVHPCEVATEFFGGAVKGWTKLKFTPERAQWVKHEESDGSYVLGIPYSDERELVGDILKYGSDVQVINPSTLMNEVKKHLNQSKITSRKTLTT